MGFVFGDQGAAASIYLVLYAIVTALAINILRKLGIKTRYTFLLFFGLIRTGAQLCGVAFASQGYSAINWLIAYLVLGAEGYFALILGSFYFLVYCEKESFGTSYYHEPLLKNRPKVSSPASIFHWILIPANVLVITGGSLIAGDTPQQLAKEEGTAKALRGAGQAIFLAQTIFVAIVAFRIVVQKGLRTYSTYAVAFSLPFLFIRGLYGLLSVFITQLNYFNTSNYSASGVDSTFIVSEYVLGTTTEFIAACAIMSTYYYDQLNKNKYDQAESVPLGGNRSQNTNFDLEQMKEDQESRRY